MAQPSGLSVSADGTTLWIADSESSALRYVRDGEMHTVVGQGLFDFGHVDGPAGAGAAPASARGVRPARRLGAGGRHVQRRGSALRPRGRCGVHGGHRPGRAERRRRTRGRRGRGGRVGRAPAHPPGPWRPRRGRCVHCGWPAASHRAAADAARARRGDPRRDLHAGARPEARRVVRPVDPAGGLGVPAVDLLLDREPASARSSPGRSSSRPAASGGVLQVVAQAPRATPMPSTPPATSPARTGAYRSSSAPAAPPGCRSSCAVSTQLAESGPSR